MRAPSSEPSQVRRCGPSGLPAKAASARAGTETAEATFAPVELVDGGREDGPVEIGPEVGDEDELGVGRLPG